jgi:hypothetical protein
MRALATVDRCMAARPFASTIVAVREPLRTKRSETSALTKACCRASSFTAASSVVTRA